MNSRSAYLTMSGGGVFIHHPKSFSEPRFPNLRMESRIIVDRFRDQKLEESGVEQNEEEIAQVFVGIWRACHP
jgi:hypothetical protein